MISEYFIDETEFFINSYNEKGIDLKNSIIDYDINNYVGSHNFKPYISVNLITSKNVYTLSLKISNELFHDLINNKYLFDISDYIKYLDRFKILNNIID
jgi:hypothetical protein